MQHKQGLIDRLLSEVDRRSGGLKACGADIVRLRKVRL
jgi:hypothetical protein